MKLIIQIPCYNEEATLAKTVADLPRAISGIEVIEYLIIDDGSKDRTIEIAREAGVHHVVKHAGNRGLAHAFRSGIDASLKLGADIIVNTDGDNQYAGADIEKLVRPILEGRADLVVGDRQTSRIAHFSPFKKLLQRLGSGVVRQLSNTEVPDTVSGFRAFSKAAALDLNIVSTFSYTIETIIQAGHKRMAVLAVPIATNDVTRASRLFKSIPHFVSRQLSTIIRMYAMYKPLRTFFMAGAILTVIGAVPLLRFLWFFVNGEGQGHVQSVILGGVFLSLGFITLMLGLIADLIGGNRQLMEATLRKVRALELKVEELERNGRP